MVNTVDSLPSLAGTELESGKVVSATRTSTSGGMSRTLLNFLLDALLLLILTAIIAISMVVQFVFPPGTTAGGWTLWGASYNAWSRLQFGLVSLLTVGVLVHVMLHWTWVCGVVASRLRGRTRRRPPDDGVRTLYGVATLIVLLALIGFVVAAANLAIRMGDTGGVRG